MEILAPNEALELFAFHLLQEMLPGFSCEGTLCLRGDFQDDRFVATAALGDKTVTQSARLSEHFTRQRTQNVACGKALFELYSLFGPARVPYGTLVGVRPVKMAVFYRVRGLSQEAVQELLVTDYCMHKEKARLLCELAETELAVERSLAENDAMLYLSIPFCPSRCRYCSFISHSAPKQLALLPQYLERMQEELLETAELFEKTGRRLRAVYLGGGTPGLLTAEQLQALFQTVKARFSLSDDAEFTAELGRPDTITKEKCDALASEGVGRICINPQTLSDKVLLENGRHHSAEEFYRAYECAKKAQIFSINTDLIAGLNGDTPQGFLHSVNEILALSPENLTIHALCKKRASEEEAPVSLDCDHQWHEAMQKADAACIKQGYRPYYLYRQKNTIANLENLGYAKSGHDCIYNIAMMQDLCDVFAVGAGAMTKLRQKTQDGYQMKRLPAYKYPVEYLNDPEKGRKNRQAALKLCTE